MNTQSGPSSPFPLVPEKVNAINFAFSRFNLRSFADLGGVWGVEGGYTFHTLRNFKLNSAALVDTHPTDMVRKLAEGFSQLRLIEGNFGSREVARSVGAVDAIFLFDVLLHQVNPDWDHILEMYSEQTNCFIIYNQQWIKSAQTVRLLDLGPEEYFENVPHDRNLEPYKGLFNRLDEKHPDHDRPWRDVHHIWQWGISDARLREKVESLGFRMQLMMNCGRFGDLVNFEDHLFVFTR